MACNSVTGQKSNWMKVVAFSEKLETSRLLFCLMNVESTPHHGIILKWENTCIFYTVLFIYPPSQKPVAVHETLLLEQFLRHQNPMLLIVCFHNAHFRIYCIWIVHRNNFGTIRDTNTDFGSTAHPYLTCTWLTDLDMILTMNANAGEFIKKWKFRFFIILISAQICMTFLFLWTQKRIIEKICLPSWSLLASVRACFHRLNIQNLCLSVLECLRSDVL